MYTIDKAPKDLTPPWEGLRQVVTHMPVYIPKVVGEEIDCPRCLDTRFVFENKTLFNCPRCNAGGSISSISVPVWAWKDDRTGETYLNADTTDYLDAIKRIEMDKNK